MRMTVITDSLPRIGLVFGLAVIVVPTVFADEPPAQPKTLLQKTKDFTEKDIVEFRRAYEHGTAMLATFIRGNSLFPKSREEAAAELVAGRAFALRVTGQTRAVERASDVARNLSYYAPNVAWREGRYVLTDWPAADALVQMGSHAYDAIYARMDDPCSALDMGLLLHIVLTIDGRELGIHRLKIKQRELAADDQRPFVKHLRELITMLESDDCLTPKYSPNRIYAEGQKNPRLLQTDDDE